MSFYCILSFFFSISPFKQCNIRNHLYKRQFQLWGYFFPLKKGLGGVCYFGFFYLAKNNFLISINMTKVNLLSEKITIALILVLVRSS